ncbi:MULTISPECIES: hypothetical protein [Sorangium]|uniref:hypothetical protein n=1 Tax=Sorangium TaxID=39643 RepID=UPI000304F7BC|nr:hypothetical protein [Sorangium cellulosum]
MKIDLAFVPGFSASLAGWEATLNVGGRGAVRCHWIGPSGPEERTGARRDLPLTPEAFERLSGALRELPEELQRWALDDAPVRHIRCRTRDGLIERRRSLSRRAATPPEAAFDRVWIELFSLVRPALVDLGMPESLVALAR